MTTTTVAQRFAAALALTTAVLLLGVIPVAAAAPGTAGQGSEQRELDGWIYGRGLATSSDSAGSNRNFRDDGWAHGWLRSATATTPKPGTFVDGWAEGQGLRSRQRSFTDGWAIGGGLQSQSTVKSAAAPSSTPAPVSVPFVVGGLVLAALLGAATAAAISHNRHVPSAR